MFEQLDLTWWAHSAFWLVTTVGIYAIAVYIFNKSKHFPLFHPLIVTTLSVLLVMYGLKVTVAVYQDYTFILAALLGPATVALAIPLYLQLRLLLQMNWRIVVPIAVASLLAPVLSWGSVYLLNAPLNLQMTMLVKSITTPLAMDTASAIGGIPALAAVFVITTGIVGAVFGPVLFKVMNVHNHAAQGTALGSVAHVIGTAKAISISEQCAAFATLGLCLNGLVTALLLPILFA